jgi:hypothetical protein
VRHCLCSFWTNESGANKLVAWTPTRTFTEATPMVHSENEGVWVDIFVFI